MGFWEWWQTHVTNKPQPAPTPTTTPAPTTTTTAAIEDKGKDKYGIKKIYGDASSSTFQHWYMDMQNPTADPRFKNEQNANLKKEADGAWSSDGSSNGKYQVRLEGWSESGLKKWLNTEITVYANFMNDIVGGDPGSYAFQVYRGGGHHSSNSPCDGAAYKARIRKDQNVVICKEILHPDYTSNRGGLKKLSASPKGRYIGVKEVVYNFVENGKTYVKIEVWIDESGMSTSGVFDPAKQNWIKMAETKDKGGWASGNGGGCPKLNKDSIASTRQSDEIMNTSGGTSEGNLAAYRTDGVKSKIKYFSIREIQAPTT
jgi:hypothetical protein